MVTIRFLGTSGFELKTDDSTLIIDPRNKTSGNRNGDLVYCTHSHFDHTGGVKTFMEKNPDALLVSGSQVISKFDEYKERSILIKDGGSYEYGPWSMEFIYCRHGFFESVENLGVVVKTDDFSFGHVGDGVRFGGFYKLNLEAIAVPIVGGFSASPSRAIEELQKFRTHPKVIPMHWMFRNPKSFCRKLKEKMPGAVCVVPEKENLIQL